MFISPIISVSLSTIDRINLYLSAVISMLVVCACEFRECVVVLRAPSWAWPDLLLGRRIPNERSGQAQLGMPDAHQI